MAKKDKLDVKYIDEISSVPDSFYADSGNWGLNFILSRDILGGFPVGVNLVAGWVGAGKTSMLVNVIRRAKIQASRNLDKTYSCFLYDTEGGFDISIIGTMLELSDSTPNFSFILRKVEHFDDFAETLLTDIIKSSSQYNIIMLDSFATLTTKQSEELEKERQKVVKNDDIYGFETQQLLLKQRQIIHLISEFLDLFTKKNIVFIITSHLYQNINTFIQKNEIKGGNYVKYISKNILVIDKASKKDSITKIVRDRAMQFLNFEIDVLKNRLGFEGANLKIVGLPIIFDPFSGFLDFLTIESGEGMQTEDFETLSFHYLPIFYKKARKYALLPEIADRFKEYFPDTEPEQTPEKWFETIQPALRKFSDFLKEIKIARENQFKKMLTLLDY